MAIFLLTVVTLAYAGYNLFIRTSGTHAPPEATSTIFAILLLQTGALVTALCFLAYLGFQGGHTFRLSGPSYLYAIAAGVCIGIAEIAYFYIYAGARPLPAYLVVPTVVAGTIAITFAVSLIVFQERMSMFQAFGALLVLVGIVIMFISRPEMH